MMVVTIGQSLKMVATILKAAPSVLETVISTLGAVIRNVETDLREIRGFPGCVRAPRGTEQ